MSVNKRQQNVDVPIHGVKQNEKICSAKEETIVFSFRHMTSCDDYNFRYFKKKKKNSEMANAIASFADKLAELSKITWPTFKNKHMKSGYEMIPISELDPSFVSHVEGLNMADDDKLIVVRFNGQNSRFVLRRGTKCRRVAFVLGIDYDLKLYKH